MTTPEILDALDRLIAESKPEDRPALVVALAARLATLGAGLTSITAPTPAEAPDENLDAQEAAKRTGMSVSYLYKHTKALPFAAKVGRRTVFSARGIDRWRARKIGA